MRDAVFVLAVLYASTQALDFDVALLMTSSMKIQLEANPDKGLNIVLIRNRQSRVLAEIGRTSDAIRKMSQDGKYGDIAVQFYSKMSLIISNEEIVGDGGERRGHLLVLSWKAPPEFRLEDCVDLSLSHWYGGPEQMRQYWPIERLVLAEYPYVPKQADFCAIAEPYWLSSEGIFYYVNKTVPLFVDQNHLQENKVCFIAEVKPPYSKKREQNELIYTIGVFDDVRQAHEYAVEEYLHGPSAIPDKRMLTDPIWSTWARFKHDISHTSVLNFAEQITNHRFSNSHIEIDDGWEICYGSLSVDRVRFPNLTETVTTLQDRGYRVTFWTHPFINEGCEPAYSLAKGNGFLVASEYGFVETSWWNDNDTTTAMIDFSKGEARSWYLNRLKMFRKEYHADSFKFDAGESSFTPHGPVLRGDVRNLPGMITEAYVRAVASFGSMVEVRTGFRTQELPVFVRMMDKNSVWTFNNGLPTLVTTLLQMNMNGYTLVLPDMIGGNAYSAKLTKELFIRWLQATTFMPALQFSYAPWDFDNETIDISRKFVDLHAEYSPQIIAACQNAVAKGAPVNPPIWWIAPTDKRAFGIWDEYLLGEKILVAPVLERGVRERDVYLPKGFWLAQGDPVSRLEGGGWHRRYPAPLDTLPFFVKVG